MQVADLLYGMHKKSPILDPLGAWEPIISAFWRRFIIAIYGKLHKGLRLGQTAEKLPGEVLGAGDSKRGATLDQVTPRVVGLHPLL